MKVLLKTRTRQRKATRLRTLPLSTGQNLQPVLQAWGTPRLVPLDVPLRETAQINYLDLLPKQSSHRGAGLHAVAEHQGTALLYLVDARGGTRSITAKGIHDLRRLLANRSESAWLGIVKPGALDLYPIEFATEVAAQPAVTIRQRDAEAPLFFQSLVHGTFRESARLPASDHVYRQILDLLKHTTDAFVPAKVLDGLEVLSMAGRALFFRFLHDRRIVEPQELVEICPSAARDGATLKDAFSTAQRAAETSAWLDKTFNGDFLPLPLVPADISTDDRPRREKAYAAYYKSVQRRAGTDFFRHLDAIMHGWTVLGGSTFQPLLDWNELQFAHIPVGVLSEVYEHFAHKVDPQLAADTSVHYTPRFIAQLMVAQSFDSMPQETRRTARVLDPACGAGIFLVLAFRKLFEAAWQATGERPDKTAIQQILYGQLRGFDVSESALRLTALALYITAIELNATQRPPSALKMPGNLRGTVLHHFGPETAAAVYDLATQAADQGLLGSLGDLPKREGLENFDSAFDLVIGNPPWTRLRDESPAARRAKGGTAGRSRESASKRANAAFTAIGQRVLKSRGLMELAKAYANPDKAPDIPFLWRAAEWAKPDATIAFAMHARLFLHTQGKKDVTWQAAQKAVAFTGIINGADLRWTKVWPDMKAPFCLAFAKNRPPGAGQGMYFVTPTCDYAINEAGRFRIDYASVNPLRPGDLESRPWLLKTLTLGTWLDVEVMNRITSAIDKTLEGRWDDWDAKGDKTGQGYNRSPGLTQSPDEFIGSLKDFERFDPTSYGIDWQRLRRFATNHKQATAHMPRTEALYQPPLVIVPQAPGEDPLMPKAFIADRPLAFSQSNYGYSCKGHPEAEAFASVIHVLAHSTLARYFVLMRSASLGSDFMRFLKADFDALPFPDPAKLTVRQKQTVLSFSERLQQGEGRMPAGSDEAPSQQALPGMDDPAAAVRVDRRKATAFWSDLNGFIFGLYGLGKEDQQVIADTLFSAAPYRRAGEDAFEPTTPACRAAFCIELQAKLQPFFAVTGETIQVAEPPGLRQDAWDHSWRFVAAWLGDTPPRVPAGLIAAAMRDANETGASIVTIRTPHRGLLIGVLDARRWWTRSRALLCARHIVQDKLAAFNAQSARRRP